MEKEAKSWRPIVEMPEKAWKDGYAAGLAGGLQECPYSVTSRNGWSWSSGHVEGLAEYRRRRSLG